MKLHTLHQLFRQWKDIVFCTENVVNGDAAGDLLEIQKLGILPSLLTLGILEASFRLLKMNRITKQFT